ncbi:MAG TPA: NUDIX domain-containing protein [Candidatus Binatia bacterium]|nr:NUDIX domain-containing protein [Candidatus Binatia bacterium]
MVREFSAGGVVLRKMRGVWFVGVIEPHMERPKKMVKKATHEGRQDPASVRALPKGAIDKGERPEQTAVREVQEETGVRADLVSKLGDIKYFYVRTWGDQARVFKVVSFYLLLYRSGKLGNISPEMRIEVQRAFWMPLEEAPALLSYRGEREVAEKALQYIAAHPELGEHTADVAH